MNEREQQFQNSTQPTIAGEACVSGSSICIHCNELYEEKFVVDFIDGICLPCQSAIYQENEDKKDNEQLLKFNEKFNKTYSIDEFYNACDNSEVTLEMCKGFPRLKEMKKYSNMIISEIMAEDKKMKEHKLNPELFDSFSDYPF